MAAKKFYLELLGADGKGVAGLCCINKYNYLIFIYFSK